MSTAAKGNPAIRDPAIRAAGAGALSIRRVAAPEDMEAVRELFREYANWLAIDVCFKDFEAELAGLPGDYAPPAGGLYLAHDGAALAGGVGFWPCKGAGACEMKRLWVRPAFRGTGLGRRLAEITLTDARAARHTRMRLETFAHLEAAVALYRDLGFSEFTPDDADPKDGILHMERAL